MKKIAFSILAAVLLMTLVLGSALAVTGDITTRDVKAYADPNFKKYVATIPAKTSVLVRAYHHLQRHQGSGLCRQRRPGHDPHHRQGRVRLREREEPDQPQGPLIFIGTQ